MAWRMLPSRRVLQLAMLPVCNFAHCISTFKPAYTTLMRQQVEIQNCALASSPSHPFFCVTPYR